VQVITFPVASDTHHWNQVLAKSFEPQSCTNSGGKLNEEKRSSVCVSWNRTDCVVYDLRFISTQASSYLLLFLSAILLTILNSFPFVILEAFFNFIG